MTILSFLPRSLVSHPQTFIPTNLYLVGTLVLTVLVLLRLRSTKKPCKTVSLCVVPERVVVSGHPVMTVQREVKSYDDNAELNIAQMKTLLDQVHPALSSGFQSIEVHSLALLAVLGHEDMKTAVLAACPELADKGDSTIEGLVASLSSKLAMHFKTKLAEMHDRDNQRSVEWFMALNGIEYQANADVEDDDHLRMTPPPDKNGPVMIKKSTIHKSVDPDQFFGVNNVHLSGWLQKRKSKRFPMWQTRFFRVGTHYLQYFQDEEKAKRRKLLAAIDLRQIVSVRYDYTSRDKAGSATDFVIELPKNRVFRLRASSPTVASRWVSGLNIAIANIDLPAVMITKPAVAKKNPFSSSRVNWIARPFLGSASASRTVASSAIMNVSSLSVSEQRMLDMFKAWVKHQIKAYPSSVDLVIQDFFLLQFLRKHVFNLSKAKEEWFDNWTWRKAYFSLLPSCQAAGVPQSTTPMSGAIVRKSLMLSIRDWWRAEWLGFDFSGFPVEYCTIAKMNPSLYANATMEDPRFKRNIERVLVDMNEQHNCRLRTLSEKEGRPITSSTLIVNLNGLGHKHYEACAFLLSAIHLIEQRFPCRFANIFIVRASWKAMSLIELSEFAARKSEGFTKVFCLSDDDYLNTLLKFMPGSSLPADLCGRGTLAA